MDIIKMDKEAKLKAKRDNELEAKQKEDDKKKKDHDLRMKERAEAAKILTEADYDKIDR